jgi:DNA-binding GntR family transcriptional regulator
MLTLRVKRTETLKGQVYRQLKSLLTSGQLEHDVFYSANQFAERLGVSRTPAREALLQLEAEGFIVAQDNRGFKVKAFSEKEARDFFEMRRLMEAYALEKLFDVPPAGILRKLEDCLERMSAAAEKGDAAAFISSDEEFHLTVISRCDNLFLTSLIMNIRDFISIFGSRMMKRKKSMQEVLEEHAQILKALKAKQKERAVDAMSRHLQNTETRLLTSQAERD